VATDIFEIYKKAAGEMVKNERLKICLASSSGGHLSQLLKFSRSWEGSYAFYVTTTEVVKEKLSRLGRVYVVGECNRQHPLQVIKVLFRCIRIIMSEKPNVIISTGAAAGCIMCFLGKLTGAKIIWIDSITNVERLSFSGRMVRYIADLFLVQWPELTKKYKRAEFVGSVI